MTMAFLDRTNNAAMIACLCTYVFSSCIASAQCRFPALSNPQQSRPIYTQIDMVVSLPQRRLKSKFFLQWELDGSPESVFEWILELDLIIKTVNAVPVLCLAVDQVQGWIQDIGWTHGHWQRADYGNSIVLDGCTAYDSTERMELHPLWMDIDL